MRILAFLAVQGLGLGCGGSALIDNDAQPRPADGASASPSADTSVSTDGLRSAELDATVGPSVDGGDGETSGGSCGPFTCPNGCCLSDGVCFQPTIAVAADGSAATDVPCGSNGEACMTCPPGYSCNGSVCKRELAQNCSQATCSGCCVHAGAGSVSLDCFEGNQDHACGSGGGECQSCTPLENGGHCVTDSMGSGHCVGVGQCDPTNCAGCCSGNLCVEGSQDIACGNDGVACQNCADDGGLCGSLVSADGAVERVCAYGCTTPWGLGPCTSYCSSPSVCSSQP
jgi:hypothetical protein